jgi:RsiW-degrading membrane proteinase PrsW (M82 family)
MICYLLIGLVFWAILSFIRRHTFKGATLMGVVRGFLIGVLLWPIIAPILIVMFWDRYSDLFE